jgi:hypothetical protein
MLGGKLTGSRPDGLVLTPAYPIALFNGASASAECLTVTMARQPDECRLGFQDNTAVSYVSEFAPPTKKLDSRSHV